MDKLCMQDIRKAFQELDERNAEAIRARFANSMQAQVNTPSIPQEKFMNYEDKLFQSAASPSDEAKKEVEEMREAFEKSSKKNLEGLHDIFEILRTDYRDITKEKPMNSTQETAFEVTPEPSIFDNAKAKISNAIESPAAQCVWNGIQTIGGVALFVGLICLGSNIGSRAANAIVAPPKK